MSSFDVVLLFSPQNCSLELLEANLTSKRRELADSLVARIKDAASRRAGRYDLLIGPRGTGKTHVLAYVEQVLRRDLGDDLRIVHLSEEEFGIGSMLDFLVACLQATAVPLDPLYEGLRSDHAVQVAEAAFLDALDAKPCLLVVENLALMLDAMDSGEQRRLRTFLQENPHISVLTSSPWQFGDSDRPDHPFHGFFLIEPLIPLTRVQARDYLIQLAEWKEDEELVRGLRAEEAQARVNAIYDLTGGNHRLLGMLSECLRADDLKTLVEPFVRLVDRELTPYYQQRLGRLPAQPNKILKTLARQQGAIPVKEIARLCFITEQTTSGQLRVLKEASLVRSEERGRESYYELQEPLLRFVLDIKEGRERLLPSLVSLLRDWYEAEELRELADSSGGVAKDYYLEALREKSRLPVSIDRAKAIMDSIPEDLARWARQAVEFDDAGDYENELFLLEKIDQEYRMNTNPPIQFRVAGALLLQGTVHWCRRGECKVALLKFEEVIKRYGERNETDLLEILGHAIMNKAFALAELAKPEAALSSLEELISRLEGREDLPHRKIFASALLGKGDLLVDMRRYEQAFAAYQEVEDRLGGHQEVELLAQVAESILSRGITLAAIGSEQEAVSVFDEVVRRFDADQRFGLVAKVTWALFNKGLVLRHLGEWETALSIFDDVLDRTSNVPSLQRLTHKAQISRCSLLQEMGRGRQAADGYLTIDFALLDVHMATPEFFASCLEGCRHNRRALAHFLNTWPQQDNIVNGLTHWVQGTLPMSEEEAAEFDETLYNLRVEFEHKEGAGPVLDLLSEARAYSLGDRKALLRLPLEARRLVERAYGISKEE